MAITAKVPKNLSKIKTKLMFNLTRRQLICFGSAALIGFPVFFLLKDTLGTDIAAILMAVLMLPFFFLGIYEKDGQPAEKVLWTIYQHRWVRPHIRVYESENLFRRLEEEKREKLEREMRPRKKGNARSRRKEADN